MKALDSRNLILQCRLVGRKPLGPLLEGPSLVTSSTYPSSSGNSTEARWNRVCCGVFLSEPHPRPESPGELCGVT